MIKKKILFDTDIGSDIDDAVCLSYMLSNPECEVVGITTVSGEPIERAKLASCLCIAAGKGDIPIYPGCPDPILTENLQPEAPQRSVLAKYEHRKEFPRVGEHIKFMVDTIRANPGEITLLAVGPMTNVALLFATDPEIPSLLKEFVCMCGVFIRETPFRNTEWNAKCDPYATKVIYDALPPVHRSLGLDVTLKVTMPAEEVRKRFTKGILPITLDMAEVWFENVKEVTFHDPLAAVCLFEDVCEFQRGKGLVDIGSTFFKGNIYWKPDKNGPQEIAVRVDSEKFFESYFKYFN